MDSDRPTFVEAEEDELLPDIRRSACVSCGTRLSGAVCSACGQRVLPRVTLRSLAGRYAGSVVHAATSLVHTVRQLLVRPERAIEDVLDGRTVSYMGPFAFAALSVAAAGLALAYSGANLGHDGWIFSIAAPVFLAGAARVVFPRGRHNYAEHLVANLYLVGIDCLLTVPLWLASPLLPRRVALDLFVGGLAAIAALHIRALARMEGGGWVARVLAILTAGVAVVSLLLSLAVMVQIVKAIAG